VTAPQRLIEADDEFERDLIRSAHADRPSPHALECLLLGLGVELSKLPPAVASTAPSVASGGKLGGAVLAKWLTAGVGIGLAAMGGADAVTRLVEHRDPQIERPAAPIGLVPARAAVPPALAASSAPEDASATPSVAPSVVVPDVAAAVTTGSSSAAVQESPPRATAVSEAERATNSFSAEPAARKAFALPAQPPATLAQEMQLLDEARRALAGGAARGALAALASYERAFPNGALQPEASVLQVRALLAAGDRAAALALGRRVIARAPLSEHAVAVRAALGLQSNP